VARLVLGEALMLEVEVLQPYMTGGVLHEKLQFDPSALIAPGVVEALTENKGLRLLTPDGAERAVRITRADSLWQGKLSIAS
jgi:hypothetical protein